MTLATTAADGSPDARVVLLRHWQDGCLGFFGGGESAKGRALRHRPEAALVFFWPGLDRQVRVRGSVEELPAAIIDDYFSSRPAANRLAAAMATQSEVLSDEDGWHGLRRRYDQRLAAIDAATVARPADWLGWQMRPRRWEFWLGQPSRLNQRLRFQRSSEAQPWQRNWLAP